MRTASMAWMLVFVAWGCGGSGGTDTGPAAPDAADDLPAPTDEGPSTDPCPACLDAADAPEPGDADAAGDADAGEPGPFVPRVDGDFLWIGDGTLTLRYDLAHGTFDLGRVPGTDGIAGARSEVRMTVDGLPQTMSSGDPGPRALWYVEEGTDALGATVTVRFDTQPAGKLGSLSTFATLHRDSPAWTFRAVVRLPTLPQEVRVREITPVTARGADGGGLSLGAGTREAALLDNGGDLMFDFRADLSQVGEKEGAFSTPGFASSYSAALCTATRSCLVAGFLSFERAWPAVATDAKAAEAIDLGGDKALSVFDLRCLYRPASDLDPNYTLSSEVAYLDFTDRPFEALQRYGRTLAAAHGTQPWSPPPSSWNSWTGGGGAPGWGQDIDETRILQNLELAAQDYLPWGMDTFAIDDGWQRDDGSWEPDPAKFPDHGDQDGMAWMAAQIAAKGFRPGLWIAPFRVKEGSAFHQQHPDWFLEMDDLGVAVLGPTTGERALDLSKPEVREWVRGVFQRVRDWGYKFVKLDFGYPAMFGKAYSTPGRTGWQVYREALKLVKETLGPEVFLLHVSAVGPCIGVCDSVRMTLDNQAEWADTENPLAQGVKPTLLTAAHRSWMGNTLWVNHPDLMFFRDGTYGDDTWDFPANEARAWALFVAIQGGVFKLGETFEFLHEHPEALSLTERLLPQLPVLPEPLDLFRLRYPEVWRVPFTGAAGTWEAWALFNWGLNRDVETLEDVPDAERVKTLPLGAVAAAISFVAVDPLAGEALRGAGDTLLLNGPQDVTMPARSGRILVVKAVSNLLPAPEFLATDRHWAGGAVEVKSITPAANQVTVAFQGLVPGVPVRAWFVARKGAKLESAADAEVDSTLAGADAADAQLVTLEFTPTAPEETLTVSQVVP